MDFNLITGFLYNALYFTVSLLIIIGVFKRPYFNVLLSDFIITFMLRLFFNKNKYHLISGLKLFSDAGVTKVDYVFVSVYGIFVIDKNNVKGRVFGSKNKNEWTLKINKSLSKFTNPIVTSNKKSQVLADFLNINSDSVYPVVIFVGDSDFKTKMPENVTHLGGIIRFVKSKQTEVFTSEETAVIINNFEKCKVNKEIITNKGKVVHVKSVMLSK